MALPGDRMGKKTPGPPLPLNFLPLGIWDRPPPEGVPGLQGMPLPDWLVLDDPLEPDTPYRQAYNAVTWWDHLLDDLPPLFPLP